MPKRSALTKLRQRERWFKRCIRDVVGSTQSAVEYLVHELAKVQQQLGTVKPRRTLEERIQRAEQRVERLLSYHVGELASDLGSKPTTPCVIVECNTTRYALRKHIVAIALGTRPPRAYVCHRCDVRKCIAADHLFWGTQRDNMRDCVLKGRKPGGKSYAETLAEAQARLAYLKSQIE